MQTHSVGRRVMLYLHHLGFQSEQEHSKITLCVWAYLYTAQEKPLRGESELKNSPNSRLLVPVIMKLR